MLRLDIPGSRRMSMPGFKGEREVTLQRQQMTLEGLEQRWAVETPTQAIHYKATFNETVCTARGANSGKRFRRLRKIAVTWLQQRPCNLPGEVASRDINQQVPAVTCCGRIRSMSDPGSQHHCRGSPPPHLLDHARRRDRERSDERSSASAREISNELSSVLRSDNADWPTTLLPDVAVA